MPFNVDPGVKPAPNFGTAQPIKANTGAGLAIAGLGDAITGIAEGVDTLIQSDIRKSIRDTYQTDNKIFGVDAAATMESSQKDSSAVGGDTPEGITKAGQQLDAARQAYQQGTLRESNYQSRLVATMRELRARYPGYEDKIDQIATQITGENPEHAARKALMHEWSTSASEARAIEAERRKDYAQWGEAGWLPPELAGMSYDEAKASGKLDQARGYVYNQRAQQYALDRDKAKLDLLDKQTKASKDQAEQMGYQYVTSLNQKIFDGALAQLGIRNQDDLFNLAMKAKQGGTVGQEALIKLDQAWGLVEKNYAAAADQFFNQPMSDREGSLSLAARISDKKKVDDIIESGRRNLQTMKDYAMKGEFGVAQFNKTLYESNMAGNSIQFLQKNPLFSLVQAIEKTGGQGAVNKFYSQNPQAMGEMDQKSQAALAAKFGIVISGMEQGLGTALNDIHNESGVDDKVKSKLVNSLLAAMSDPSTPEQQYRNITQALFGPGNLDFMTKAKLSDKDKETVFRLLTSEQMTRQMFNNRQMDPIGWKNYQDWVKGASQGLYRQAADDIMGYVKASGSMPFKIIYDGKQFAAVPDGQFPTESFDPTAGQPTQVSLPGQIQRSIDRLNIGLENAKNVATLNGQDPNSVYGAFTKGLTIDLNAAKNPGFMEGIVDGVKKWWNGGGTPEEKANAAKGKLGSTQDYHDGLKQARAQFQQELDASPILKSKLFAMVEAEAGGQGPQNQQIIMEQILNRAAARGQTLAQALSSSYYPDRTHSVMSRRLGDPSLDQKYQTIYDSAMAGSNLGKFTTGNGSLDPTTGKRVGFNGGIKVGSLNGEDFGVEGPDMEWYKTMSYQEGSKNPGQSAIDQSMGGSAGKGRTLGDYQKTIDEAPGVDYSTFDTSKIKPAVKTNLDTAQSNLDFPIKLRSGFRDPTTNKDVGGAQGSEHLSGNAVDIDLRGLDDSQRTHLVAELVKAGFNRLGAYSGNTGLHVDMKDQRQEDGSPWPMMDRTINNMDSAPSWFKLGLRLGWSEVKGKTNGGKTASSEGTFRHT